MNISEKHEPGEFLLFYIHFVYTYIKWLNKKEAKWTVFVTMLQHIPYY